jgi:hypothetical protein
MRGLPPVERGWFERLRCCRLYCYHLPPETFECMDEGAASVSQALRALFDAAKRNRAWDSSLERVLRGRDAAEQ